MAMVKKLTPKNISDEKKKGNNFGLSAGTSWTATLLYVLQVFLLVCFLETNSNSVSGEVRNNENFADGYWIKVGLAKVMSVAKENGKIPKLSETYQLIEAARCVQDDTNCRNFVSECARSVADDLLKQLTNNGASSSTKANLPNYMRHIWIKCGMSKENSRYQNDFQDPSLPHQFNSLKPPLAHYHCTRRTSSDITSVFFRMKYSSDQILGIDGLPKNISTPLIPRYFVIENYNDLTGQWNFLGNTNVFYSWLIEARLFQPRTVQLRVTAVSPSYIYPPVVHSPIRIYNFNQLQNIRLSKPIDIRVANISVDKITGSPSALVRWKSGSGLTASCDYDIFYKGSADIGIMHRIEIHKYFLAKLDNLEFERDYTVTVVEKFGGGLESRADFNFNVPSCLELTGFSLELCPTSQPSNVTMVHSTDNSIPTLIPDSLLSDWAIREILTPILALFSV